MKNRKKIIMGVLCGLCVCTALCGCGKEKKKDESSEKVMAITITPEPSPTPAPEQLNPDAVAKSGNLTMINSYLIEEEKK